MIEKITGNLYRIEIPLPENPLKAINSYVVKERERNLIIDTGWNRKECMDVMQAALKELEVDLRKTDFFITHLHSDHLGLVSNIATENSTIYFNRKDAEQVESGFPLHEFVNFACSNGFPENELQAILQDHPGKFGLRENLTFKILNEYDTIKFGDFVFNCIETPGHTKGHMCLYEPNKKILVSGDHILKDITPNIQLWSDEGNPLKEYLSSLDKVYDLDIALVLPGHRGIFRNYRERIQELKRHHQRRLDEILLIFKNGGKSAFQLASQMSWDIAYQYDSWDQFPVLQKWFATGEAIAHLKYLKEKGMIGRNIQGEKIIFYGLEYQY